METCDNRDLLVQLAMLYRLALTHSSVWEKKLITRKPRKKAPAMIPSAARSILIPFGKAFVGQNLFVDEKLSVIMHDHGHLKKNFGPRA